MRRIFAWSYMMLAVLAAAVVCCAAAEREYVAAVSDGRGVRLPVIMYHSVLDSEEKAGKYIVTPGELEEDIKYIKQKGYEAVSMSDVAEYVNDGRRLPDKPIVLTFDDGCYNFYSYVYPLLEKYDVCAEVAVIGKYADMYSAVSEPPNNNYTCLNWDELREMQASGRVEILNHSYDMHGTGREGLKQQKNEKEEEYINSVKADITLMQSRMQEELGKSADIFVYPFGYTTDAADRAVRELGFLGTFTCYEHVNVVTDDKESLYNLGRFNRPHGKPPEEFFKGILE